MPSTIETVIIDSARRHGVDPYLAVAVATVESGLDPHAQGDIVHGEPTSYGLYQLHRGGELGELTPEQAFDPKINADIALAYMGQVAAAHSLWSPGEIAAKAQRPAHPNTYAARVNALFGALVGPTYTVLWRPLRMLSPYERGSDVRALQHRLGITPDAVFGPVTLAHVQSFQASVSLDDDGIVGKLTSHALGWRWDG